MDLLVCGSPVLVGVILPLFWWCLLSLVVCIASVLWPPLVTNIQCQLLVWIRVVVNRNEVDRYVVLVLVLALARLVSLVLVA